jgi:peptidylprolyl isomerase
MLMTSDSISVLGLTLVLVVGFAAASFGGQRPLPAPPDVEAAPADAETTASGLASKVIEAGTGSAHPGPTSNVTVHYTGWTTDGEMFDSSVVRGQPASFPLNRVIAGWTEGVQMMVVGETRRFWIPGNLAYGDNPRPGAPRGMLVFDVELLGIQ